MLQPFLEAWHDKVIDRSVEEVMEVLDSQEVELEERGMMAVAADGTKRPLTDLEKEEIRHHNQMLKEEDDQALKDDEEREQRYRAACAQECEDWCTAEALAVGQKRKRVVMIRVRVLNDEGMALLDRDMVVNDVGVENISIQVSQRVVAGPVSPEDDGEEVIAQQEREAADDEVLEAASQRPECAGHAAEADRDGDDLPPEALAYYCLWKEGFSEATVKERWGTRRLDEFKRRPSARKDDGDAGQASNASTQEFMPEADRTRIREVACFDVAQLDLNLARWDQWRLGHVSSRSIKKAGVDPLLCVKESFA